MLDQLHTGSFYHSIINSLKDSRDDGRISQENALFYEVHTASAGTRGFFFHTAVNAAMTALTAGLGEFSLEFACLNCAN